MYRFTLWRWTRDGRQQQKKSWRPPIVTHFFVYLLQRQLTTKNYKYETTISTHSDGGDCHLGYG